jgi:DNA gyrase subunit A
MMVRTPVSDVRIIGRNTQGVRLINLDESDALVSASVVEAEQDDSDASPATAEPGADGAVPPIAIITSESPSSTPPAMP